MRRVIIKEGPLVFLRNVLVMEFVAAIFLFILSFLQNYEMLYRNTGLANLVRYDIFLIVTFSVLQLVYISILFFDWYFSHFEINDREIVKKHGLLFRHQRAINHSDVVSVETYYSPLGRMMRHATIILHHGGGRTTKIRNVLNADEYIHAIKQMSSKSSEKLLARDVLRLIREGEDLTTEFKETLRYDKRRNTVSKEMERMVMKTVVAFLNTKGGTLVVGVSDQGEVAGLEDDYKTLEKKNRDGFENHIGMLVKSMIGLPFMKYVGVKFEKMEGKEVCVIYVGESHRPAYLRNEDKKEDFFVRIGNSTQPFSMSETEEYIKTRWK
jgi:membrane protein YdbS with pleckstrin-like domain